MVTPNVSLTASDAALDIDNFIAAGVDILAPSIGNVHGDYGPAGPKEGQLHYDRLEAIDKQIDALDRFDRGIARAIFVPDLLFTNSDTGAYALGQEHRSIFDANVEGDLDDLGRQVTVTVIDRLVRLNFGDRAPRARLVFAGVTDEDRSELWELAKLLVAGGRLPVEVVEVAARLGIPMPDGEARPCVGDDPGQAAGSGRRLGVEDDDVDRVLGGRRGPGGRRAHGRRRTASGVSYTAPSTRSTR